MIRVQPNDLVFKTDTESLKYFIEIVEIMMTRFGITSIEAVGRINKQLSHIKSITEDNDHEIYREFPGYWANDIYLGHASFWWVENEERTRLNLPDLKPLPYDGEK